MRDAMEDFDPAIDQSRMREIASPRNGDSRHFAPDYNRLVEPMPKASE